MILSLCCCPLLPDARADVPAKAERDREMERLRDRQAFADALAECAKHLDSPKNSAEERAYWTRWQLEFLTLQALEAEDPFPPDNWQSLTDHWNRYPRSQPTTPFDVEVDLQYWMGREVWYELLGDWSELTTETKDWRRRALDGLREVERELTKLSERLESVKEEPNPKTRGQITPLRALKYRIAYQRGVTSQTRATLYPVASPDRVLLLTEALKAFSPVARLVNDSPLVLSSQIREIQCQRLLGNDAKAAQLLNAFAGKHPIEQPGELRLQWLIERAELETAMRSGATQLAALSKASSAKLPRSIPSDLVAKAHWTILSGAVDRWQVAQQAGDVSGGQRWQIQAIASQRALEANHSRLWVRRGEALLAKTFATSPADAPPEPNNKKTTKPSSRISPSSSSPSASRSDSSSSKPTRQRLEIEVRTANDAFTRGEKEKALAAYDEAAATAQQLADDDLTFRLRFQAAAIVHEQQDHEKAISRFRPLSLEQKGHARAAEGHWIAVLHAAAIASRSEAAAKDYEDLLHEHLAHWSSDPTANEARFWLGKLLNQRGQTAEAQAEWEAIDGEFKNWLELWPQLRAIYLAQWSKQHQTGADLQPLIQHVTQYWSRWNLPLDTQRKLSPLECVASYYGAEWRILYGQELSDELREILAREIQAADCPADIRMRANALAGLLAAAASDPSTAAKHWTSVDWTSLELTENVLRELDRIASLRGQGDATSVSQLLLDIAFALRDVPAWADNPDLWQFTSRAYLRMGKRDEALRVYQRQATRHPKQAIWFAELARLQEQSQATQDAEKALEHWRVAVRYSPEGSELWFDGKLGIVRMLLRLQQPERASEVIRLLENLHSDLGGPERAAQFRTLSQQATESTPRERKPKAKPTSP